MPPILVVELFPEVSAELVGLLRSLTAEQWRRPTVSSQRTVKDIASHLLDGSLRRLSMQRDAYQSADVLPRDGEHLVDFLHRVNREWEVATRRLSPRVIADLIEWADLQLFDLFGSLDPHGPALFPVAWAGENQSQNWMDVAREYTEKWHHTQQIFEATGRPTTIMTRRLGHPCLDTFMRALPFTFRDVKAPKGAIVSVVVTGEAGGAWHIEQEDAGWRQAASVEPETTATVTMDQQTAWKLVTKRRTREAVLNEFPMITIAGDVSLGSHVLEMVSVMA